MRRVARGWRSRRDAEALGDAVSRREGGDADGGRDRRTVGPRSPAWLASALCLLGCADQKRRSIPTLSAGAPLDVSLGCVTAWTSTKARSMQSQTAPSDGGYRRLDAIARGKLVGRILDQVRANSGDTGTIEARTFNALGAALHDVTGDLRRCMGDTDRVGPSLQYVLRIHLVGARHVGTVVDQVTVRRITEIRSDGSVVEAVTSAEGCFRDILAMLELPPAGGPASMETVVRYEDCVPSMQIPRGGE